jgi:subtilisin family serine protease
MYPFLHKAGTGSNAYMQLSGSSMAAPMVSGGVALLLQGQPGLTRRAAEAGPPERLNLRVKRRLDGRLVPAA